MKCANMHAFIKLEIGLSSLTGVCWLVEMANTHPISKPVLCTKLTCDSTAPSILSGCPLDPVQLRHVTSETFTVFSLVSELILEVLEHAVLSLWCSHECLIHVLSA